MTLAIYYSAIVTIYLIISWTNERLLKRRIKSLEETNKVLRETIAHAEGEIQACEQIIEIQGGRAKNYKALAEGKPFIIHINGKDFSNN